MDDKDGRIHVAAWPDRAIPRLHQVLGTAVRSSVHDECVHKNRENSGHVMNVLPEPHWETFKVRQEVGRASRCPSHIVDPIHEK
jgi:hypothetical protein